MAMQPQTLWDVIGWTMVHFAWLGTIVFIGTWLSLRLLRGADPALRYAVALTWFLVMAVTPIAIASTLWRGALATPTPKDQSQFLALTPARETGQSLADAVASEGGGAPMGADSVVEVSPLDLSDPTAAVATPTTDVEESGLSALLDRLVTALPWVWFLGTPVTLGWLAVGLWGTGRIRRRSQIVYEGPVRELCARLGRSLNIARPVAIGVCDFLTGPVLLGIVRPTILFPTAALTGWPAEHLEMALLHELSHIRRWDNLVNLLQRIAEALYFFHPCVWLLSGQIRYERECCCDSTVVRYTGQPRRYAQFLVAIADCDGVAAAATVGMAEEHVVARVRYILGPTPPAAKLSGGMLAMSSMVLLLVATVSAGGYCLMPRSEASAPVEPYPQENPVESDPEDSSTSAKETEPSQRELTEAERVAAKLVRQDENDFAHGKTTIDHLINVYFQAAQVGTQAAARMNDQRLQSQTLSALEQRLTALVDKETAKEREGLASPIDLSQARLAKTRAQAMRAASQRNLQLATERETQAVEDANRLLETASHFFKQGRTDLRTILGACQSVRGAKIALARRHGNRHDEVDALAAYMSYLTSLHAAQHGRMAVGLTTKLETSLLELLLARAQADVYRFAGAEGSEAESLERAAASSQIVLDETKRFYQAGKITVAGVIANYHDATDAQVAVAQRRDDTKAAATAQARHVASLDEIIATENAKVNVGTGSHRDLLDARLAKLLAVAQEPAEVAPTNTGAADKVPSDRRASAPTGPPASWRDQLLSADPKLRELAVDTLGRMDPDQRKEAIPYLISLLASGQDTAPIASQALARIGPEAVPALSEALADPDLSEWWIASALGKMGPAADAAVDALIEGIKQPRDERIAYGMSVALGAIGPAALPALIQLLQDESQSPQARELAVVGLANMGPKAEPAVPAILAAMTPDHRNLHVQSLYALERIGPGARAAIPDLLTSLRTEKDDDMRQRIIAVLGDVGKGNPEVQRELLKCLNDPHPDHASAAVHGIARIALPLPEAVDPLIAFIERQDGKEVGHSPDNRKAARAALAAVGEAAVEPCRAALGRDSVHLREDMAKVLGTIGPPAKASLPDLRRTLDQDTTAVATAAASAIGRIDPNDPESQQALIRSVDTSRHEEVREAAILALGSADEAARIAPVLLGTLEDPNDRIRQAAIRALAGLRTSDPATIAALNSAARTDREENVRELAEQAVKWLHDDPTVPQFFRLLFDRRMRRGAPFLTRED